VRVKNEMRTAILATLLVGYGVYAMGATVTPQSSDSFFMVPNDALQGFAPDAEGIPDSGATPIAMNIGSASEDAGKTPIQGPEPTAAFLAVSGLTGIAFLGWYRRISVTIHRSRRRVYTIRQLA
jgi:hypothetical protein